GFGGVAFGDVLGQVLGQVAHAPVGVGRARHDPLGVDLASEAHHVEGFRSRVGVQGVQRLVPGGQHFTGGRVEVVTGRLVEGGQVRPVVDDLVGGRPPHLVVGRGGDLAQLGPGQGAAHGHVQVRGEAPLRFDRGEVLDVVAGHPPQVLHEPVHELGEVDRVPGGAPVVVAGRIHRGAVALHPAI